jgi:alkanesulfonate monooxygenase SsuD/methylene tetrahydromethanopterin reductase-like flavin-dependent oxidoreductase (luciferase family)
MKVGLTLPSFVRDPEVPLAIACTAEAAGLDGVFVYDHLFRRARDGSRRPALEGPALLAAVAAATSRIGVGGLVFRSTLRSPATLAAALDGAHRIAGPRLLPTIGSGDHESREENETFGLPFGTMPDRVEALRKTVLGTRDRGYPVWVGGLSAGVRAIAATDADGWNRWGGAPDRFAADVAALRRLASRDPFTCSWGGLFVMGRDDDAAREKAERLGASEGAIVGGPSRIADALLLYGDAGAEWVMIGPVDSGNPENATLLGEEVLPRLA